MYTSTHIHFASQAILCGALMSHPQGYLPPGASSYSNGGGAGGGGVNDSRMAVNVNGAAHLNNDKFSGLLFIIAMFTINLMLLIGAVQVSSQSLRSSHDYVWQ